MLILLNNNVGDFGLVTKKNTKKKRNKNRDYFEIFGRFSPVTVVVDIIILLLLPLVCWDCCCSRRGLFAVVLLLWS